MELDKSSIIQRVTSLAKPVIDGAGIELVEIELTGRYGNYILRILIEKPGGVTIDDCVAVNRELSCLLDVDDPIPSRYTLEVSSPGLDRPFKTERDYERALGKWIKVSYANGHGKPVTCLGRLSGIEDGLVEIDRGEECQRIPISTILKAHRELD